MGLKLEFIKYRKFENITFEFNKNINIIAGVNGTCKSSLLYVISNSFQQIRSTFYALLDKKFILNTKQLIKDINPKFETLSKTSKYKNDFNIDVKGSLYSITYSNNIKLRFRRYVNKKNNIKEDGRLRIIPQYSHKKKEKLEYKFIIYLGLSRLLSYGEYHGDDIKKIEVDLPEKYKNVIKELYKEFTNFDIDYKYNEAVSNIKNRGDFSTNIDGIDSNTISAGEDNLFIILQALVSFEYYYDSLDENYRNNEEFVSIFLIDELDATLHPYYQNKLLDLLKIYSMDFKIKIIFTTHSLSLLEYALKDQNDVNIIYLIKPNNKVMTIENPSIYKIKQHLFNITKNTMYKNIYISIFTEDEEARILLGILFDYFDKKYHKEFSYIKDKFLFMETKIGADNLKSIFKKEHFKNDQYLGICILDGDQNNNLKDKLGNCILCLPGNKSPEELFFEYIIKIINNYDAYDIKYKLSNYYTKDVLINIVYEYKKLLEEIQIKKDKEESIKGIKRDNLKPIFKSNEENHKYFFELWINENEKEVWEFYKNLNILFKKVSHCFDIDSNEWNIEDNKGD